MYGSIYYTQKSMWNFIEDQWINRIQQWESGNTEYSQFVANKTIRTPCDRATEVYMCSCLHGHVQLNQFLWNLSLTSSPLCDCKEHLEEPEHVIFRCKEFQEKREECAIEGESLLQYLNNIQKSPTYMDQLKNICRLMKHIKKVKKESGRKELPEYFKNKTKED